MDIAAKLWGFCHILRHDGMDYADYIEQLTYLLFLKMADENGVSVPESCQWKEMLKLDGSDLKNHYEKVLILLKAEKGILGKIFQEPISKIQNPVNLKKIIDGIEDIGWTSLGKDVQGEAFEGLLERTANEGKKGAGQFFTPRPLIQAIVNVLKPNPVEKDNFKISDVACGTAGFLTVAADWVRNNHSEKNLTTIQKKHIRETAYYGQELVMRPYRLGLMNMFLHGIEANLVCGDSIYDNVVVKNQFDCVLTNPPFGSRGSIGIPKMRHFQIETTNIQLNFIQHIYEVLSDGGRAGIVLPDSCLTDYKAREIWEYLIGNELCNVHTILKLPRGTFAPYANGVKACVIFLQKGVKTKNLWVYDARSNVKGITKVSRPLDFNTHFENFVKSYGPDPNGNSGRLENDRFKKFSYKEIVSNQYELDFKWIEDSILLDENDVDKPLYYLDEIRLNLNDILDTLKNAEDFLERK